MLYGRPCRRHVVAAQPEVLRGRDPSSGFFWMHGVVDAATARIYLRDVVAGCCGTDDPRALCKWIVVYTR